MAIRFSIDGRQVGRQFRLLGQKYGQRARKAARESVEEVTKTTIAKVHSDIRGAGNFGSRWTTRGFKGRVTGSGNSIQVTYTQAVPYWTVFQTGKTIHGRPLLWIPLSFASDALGVRARDYPGRLFRVNRKGGKAPLLLSASDGEPKYHGQTSVRIPKKFHTIEIIRDEARTLRGIFIDKLGL